MTFTQLEKKMIAHGAAVTFIGMVAGLGLLVSLLGGIELIPGTIMEFPVPGPTDAWVRAHVGGILNGMLTIGIAVIMSGIGIAGATAKRVFWMIAGSGWAFTVFYWAALFAPNRALSIGDNKWGESNLAAIIGFVPALAFTVFDLIGVYIVMMAAFRSARD